MEKIDLAKTEGVGFVEAVTTGIQFHRPDGKVTKLEMIDVMESGDAHLQLLFANYYMGTIQAQAASRQVEATERLAAALLELTQILRGSTQAGAQVNPKQIVQDILDSVPGLSEQLGNMVPGANGGPTRIQVDRPAGENGPAE